MTFLHLKIVSSMFVKILIFAVIGGAILGFLNTWFAKFLDFCLDYGHIFGGYRLKLAKQSAKRQDIDISEDLEAVKELDFAERISFIDGVYWNLANNDGKFLKWICIICFGTRVNVTINVIILSLLAGLNWSFVASNKLLAFLVFFVFIFASNSVLFYFLTKDK